MDWKRGLVSLIALGLSSGCFSFETPDPRVACGEGYCESGEICVDAACYAVCSTLADCAANEACIEGTCRVYSTTCTANGNECAAGFFCRNEVCVRQLGTGEPCLDDDRACLSGFCRDGLCCSTACDAACMSCRGAYTAGADGTCAAITDGDDPGEDCAGAAACNGAGGCWNTGLGLPCDFDYQCAAGYCADGVCCDAACTDLCLACVATLSGGTDGLCAAVLDGTDLDEECAGPLGCNGAGGCWSKTVGDACDADFECDNGLCVDGTCCESGCDQDCRRCDAAGLCRTVANLDDPDTCGTSTVGGSCTAPPCSCDASGICRPSTAVPCSSGGTCLSGVCRGGICCDDACAGPCTSCNSTDTGHPNGECWPATDGRDPQNECAGVIACDGTGVCHDTTQGSACTNDYECATGVCDDRDHVCCNVECTGTCRACHGNQTEAAAGTCADIANYADPDNECLGTNTHLTCNGAAACYDKTPGASCTRSEECRTNDCCGLLCRWGWTVQYDSPNNLLAVWAVSATSVYAVGNNGTVVQYNGSTWTETTLQPPDLTYPIPLVDIQGNGDTIAAVSAADDIFTKSGSGAWVANDMPGTTLLDAAVWVESASRAWVLTNGGLSPDVYYHNLSNRLTYYCSNCTPSPDSGTPSNLRLTAATGDGLTFYSAGYTPATPPYDGTVYSYTFPATQPNNGTWTNLAFPYGKPNDIEFQDGFLSNPDLLYVPYENSTGNGIASCLLSTFAWSTVSPAPPVAPKALEWFANTFPDGAELAMIVGGSSNVYVLIARTVGGNYWATRPTGATGVLQDLHGSNKCDMFAVSANGEIVRR